MNIPLPSQIPSARPTYFDIPEEELHDPAPNTDAPSERKARPTFVRSAHLTDKALAKHPGLIELKNSLETNRSQTPKPKPRRRQTSSAK